MLSGSELWLTRLMADRGRSLVAARTVLVVLAEGQELHVVGGSTGPRPRVSILPIASSALGAVHGAGRPLALRQPSGPEAAWLRELGLDAAAALLEPLPSSEGLVIALRDEGPPFTAAEVQALHSFAGSLAQRLAAERSVELERLRHGLEARERERKRWARELHDETIQGLGGIRMRLALARDDEHNPGTLRGAVDEALQALSDEIDGLRHLITDLRPAALDDLGLVAAIEALARRAAAIDGVAVTTDLRVDVQQRFDPELESALYRIVQEALTNIGRHANAERALVLLTADGSTIDVLVRDDGRGLGAPREGGFGLESMRERAEQVGGRLDVANGREGGTDVTLSVPLAGRGGR